jgi:DNA processing protein
VAAAVATSDSLEAWQTLLAAELTPVKALEFGRRIEAGGMTRERLLTHPSLTAAEAQRAARAQTVSGSLPEGIALIPSSAFPELVTQISLPPPAVFAWGDFSVTSAPTAAIVGTRGASAYGRAVATKFAESLARAGVTIVSGGAVGIDEAAHRGALNVGGKTVAVVAAGIEATYPVANAGLFRSIRETGCLVSQYAIGTKPNAYRFLVRNGLIAALSQVTILIEAPLRSGGLRTAHSANEFGRQVFVVPANIDNANFAGSHALIRDGATLVDHPDQVLEAMDLAAAPARTLPTYLSDTARMVHQVLGLEPHTVERIVELTGLDPSIVLSDLTMLEVEGVVMREPQGFVTRL